MKALGEKIKEALVSALPITLIVYLLALTPLFNLNRTELITFTVGAVLLVVGIGMFNLGADLAMTPVGTHVGAGLSRQRKLGLLLSVCFVLGMLITIAEPDLQVLGIFSDSGLAYQVPDYSVSEQIFSSFLQTAGHTAKEVAIALRLIVVFFLICQLAFLKLPKKRLKKEILMIVTEKTLRDGILNAIYKQMGMAKKAQGIAFSLPVSDVAVLVKATEKQEE